MSPKRPRSAKPTRSAAAAPSPPVARAAGHVLRSSTVGALPILDHLLRRMRLEEFLRAYLPPEDRRTKLSPAKALLLLLRNLLVSREPIYGVGEWAARHAHDLLGLTQQEIALLNDDRVLTYIRYGPARREQYETRFIDTETSRIFVNPAEIWSYDSLGRQLDFVRTGTAFKTVGESKYGPRAVMPALEPAVFARSAPEFASDARPLGLEVSLGRLGQHGDSVEVELAFGIPLRTILAEFQPQSQPLINVTIDLAPRAKGTPAHRSTWVGCPMPPDTTTVDFAVGREVFDLPADVYTFSVTAVTSAGQAASRKVQDLNLIDYSRRNQPVSDVLFY